jgi:hypothetical protein
MIERFLHQVKVELPPGNENVADARARLAGNFPRAALRRMTHLGLLLGSALEAIPVGPEDAVVYASTFGETRSLEEFLRGFPTPSPLLFQSSIHPGGVQQVLIGRQQPVARLWPLAGRARLVEQALLTVLLEPAPRVILAGGEETGTWLVEHDLASGRSFAFALVVTRSPADAAARFAFTPGDPAEDPCPTLEKFAQALTGRHALQWSGAGGLWKLDWL